MKDKTTNRPFALLNHVCKRNDAKVPNSVERDVEAGQRVVVFHRNRELFAAAAADIVSRKVEALQNLVTSKRASDKFASFWSQLVP